jgi:glutamate/tyrosine decarboxylase-like PLP-dependent enzyme
MHPVLPKLIREVADFHDDVPNLPTVPCVTAREIRCHLRERYGAFERPMPLEALLEDVRSMMRKWIVHNTHPRYFGLFNPSVHLAAVMADTLVAAYNPQLAVWSQAPGAQEIERFTLEFFLERLGFDPGESIACFTSGGAEANQSAVLAALSHAFPRYGDEGVAALESMPLLYASGESHHSLEKIAHMTGIGRKALKLVRVDRRLRLDTADLQRRIAEDRAKGYHPFMVVGTAGTTGAGIIDPLEEIANLCGRENLWFHVDAAWGGAAVLSPKLQGTVKGIESADSVTWDAHKWLSVPMGAGMFFCRHRDAVAEAFRATTPYMPGSTEDTFDPYITTIQWSRRFTGLKVFMALAEMGAGGYGEEIEHQARMGRELEVRLVRKGWKVVNETPLPVVCFTHERIETGKIAIADILNKIYEQGRHWLSEVRLPGGARALRVCICSYRTGISDIDLLVRELEEIIND